MSLDYRYYSACAVRRALNDANLLQLSNLKAGYEGEQIVRKLLADKLNSTSYLVDQWFGKNGNFCQIDALIFSDDVAYLIEVKNYSHDHVYKKGSWWVGNERQTYDPFGQMKRASGMMRRLLKNRQVVSLLVFANEHSSVIIEDTVPFHVLTLTQFQTWLEKISPAQQEDLIVCQQAAGLAVDPLRAGYFYRLTSDYPLQPGCYCKQCGNFHLQVNLRNFSCPCGFVETKQAMAARMIDEYAMLFYRRPITFRGVQELTAGMVNSDSFLKEITKYERIDRLKYKNPYSRYLVAEPTVAKSGLIIQGYSMLS